VIHTTFFFNNRLFIILESGEVWWILDNDSSHPSGWSFVPAGRVQLNKREIDPLTVEEREFLNLSREMYRHSRGMSFEESMKTFPPEKFYRWCNLGSQI
jgi:hypothetical protein